MKPSQLEASRPKLFDFDVPDHRPRRKKKRLGPKLLPISLLLPNDLLDVIKQKYEEKGITYYVIGDPHLPADRRQVSVREILQYVSRRALEVFECGLLSQEEQKKVVLNSIELTPSEEKAEAEAKMFTHTSTPQQNALGMSVAQNDHHHVFTDVDIENTTIQSPSPETASTRRHKRKQGPFLPDSDEDESIVTPTKSRKAIKIRQDIDVDEKKLETYLADSAEDIVLVENTRSRKKGKSDLFLSSSPASVNSMINDSSETSTPRNQKSKKRKSFLSGKDKLQKMLGESSHTLEEHIPDEDRWWEVEAILADKVESNAKGLPVRMFKIDWVGDYDPTWEKQSDVSPDLIEEYFRGKAQHRKNRIRKPLIINLEDSDDEPISTKRRKPIKSKSPIKLDDSEDEPLSNITKSPIAQLDKLALNGFRELKAAHDKYHGQSRSVVTSKPTVLEDIVPKKARLNSQQSPDHISTKTVSKSSQTQTSHMSSRSLPKRSVKEIREQARELYSPNIASTNIQTP